MSRSGEESSPASPARSLASATACVIAATLFVWLLAAAGLLLERGSLADLGRWYADGGVFMHLLTLLAMLQFAVSLALGVLLVHRALPVSLLFVVPALILLVGISGLALGQQQLHEALAHAPAEMRLSMLAMGSAIADIPREYALGLAGAGCLGALVVLGAASFAHHGGRGSVAAAVVTGGVTAVLLLGVAGVAVALRSDVIPPARLVLVGLNGLLLAASLALVAGSLGGLSRTEAAARVWPITGAALVASVGWAVGVGAAMSSARVQEALAPIATTTSDMTTPWLASTLAASSAVSMCELSVGLAIVALLGSASLVAWAWPARRRWSRATLVDLGLVAALVGLVGGAEAAAQLQRAHQTAAVLAACQLVMPAGLALPTGESPEVVREPGELVAVDGRDLFVGERPVGQVGEAAAAAALAERLGRVAEAPVRRALSVRAAPGDEEEPEAGQPGIGVLPALRARDAARETACAPTAHPPVTLALAGGAATTEVFPALRWLAEQGWCEAQLALAPAPTAAADQAAALALLYQRLGMAGALLRAAREQHAAVSIALDTRQVLPEASLVVTVTSTEVVVRGLGEPDDPWAPRSVAPDLLAAELGRLLAAADQPPAFFVQAGALASVQHLVDATLAVQEVRARQANPAGPISWLVGERLFGRLVDSLRESTSDVGSLAGELDNVGGLGLRGHGATVPAEADLARRAEIRQVIHEASRRLRYCYEKRLTQMPGIAGKITVRFTIAEDGTVSGAEVSEATLRDQQVQSCVLGVFRRLRFRAGDAPVTVDYPLVFKAE